MLDFDKKIAELCAIALYEFYLTHKKDMPALSEAAREISNEIVDMIAAKFEKGE